MHLSTQAWFDIVYTYGIIMCNMLTYNPVSNTIVDCKFSNTVVNCS